MIKNLKFQLFSFSFLILFLELSLMRFLPTQIVYLGYYTNFLLLASFIGIGSGILLAKRKFKLLPFFPWILFLILLLSIIFTVTITFSSVEEVHFANNFIGILIPEIILVPFIFVLVTITMALISQRMGDLLNSLPPLTAYTFDICGSLVGIAVFTLFSYLRIGPFYWFVFFSIYFLLVNWKKTISTYIMFIPFLSILAVTFQLTHAAIWSPYQKITVRSIYADNKANNEIIGHQLFVNNVLHQEFYNSLDNISWFYTFPYEAFKAYDFKNILIIGSGAGNDVSVALKYGVKHIDAVEIDPVIYVIGKEANSLRPCQNPYVSAYITDGRSYLERTDKKYDLIIYGLPDSLIMAATHGNIRLESFLFTKEAFRSVKEHLTDNGVFILYNYYREPWLINKLATMLDNVFAKETYVQIRDPGYNAVLINGNKYPALKTDIAPSVRNQLSTSIKPATDDWPFLYLFTPSLPLQYIKMLGVITLFIYLMLSNIMKRPIHSVINPTYFFMGVAFMMLESKSLIHFSLLFGSTWLVNSLVFFALLLIVLIAIRIVNYFHIKNIGFWYITLCISLFLQLIFPLQILLKLTPVVRYISVSFITLLPVFLANIIFSYHFNKSKDNSLNFSSNMLGSGLGGILEYAALLVGYHNLVPMIMVSYLLAFLPTWIKNTSHP